MTAKHEMCQHCGQWLNTQLNHYVVVQIAGMKYYLHHNPCLTRHLEQHPSAQVVEEHVNQRR
jgi:hypothetical protein